MGVHAAAGAWIINFIIFFVFSVLFATIASFLTNTYAAYAKQSGIPEIKTVLGGFVIRRLLGAWTLVIKSIGLVSCLSLKWLAISNPTSVCLFHRVCG